MIRLSERQAGVLLSFLADADVPLGIPREELIIRDEVDEGEIQTREPCSIETVGKSLVEQIFHPRASKEILDRVLEIIEQPEGRHRVDGIIRELRSFLLVPEEMKKLRRLMASGLSCAGCGYQWKAHEISVIVPRHEREQRIFCTSCANGVCMRCARCGGTFEQEIKPLCPECQKVVKKTKKKDSESNPFISYGTTNFTTTTTPAAPNIEGARPQAPWDLWQTAPPQRRRQGTQAPVTQREVEEMRVEEEEARERAIFGEMQADRQEVERADWPDAPDEVE